MDKREGVTTISLAVKDNYWDQESFLWDWELVGLDVAPTVGGLPLRIRLTNSSGDTMRVLGIQRLIIGLHDEIYYFGSADDKDAKALGKVLLDTDFLTDRGVTVFLSKSTETAVGFVVNENAIQKPETLAAFENLIKAIAPAVGGLPVRMRFLDTSLETKKEVVVSGH